MHVFLEVIYWKLFYIAFCNNRCHTKPGRHDGQKEIPKAQQNDRPVPAHFLRPAISAGPCVVLF